MEIFIVLAAVPNSTPRMSILANLVSGNIRDNLSGGVTENIRSKAMLVGKL